jgi:hypothetical protein
METIDTSNYVSDFTKRTLQQFGWEQGDPLPASFGDMLSAVRDRTPPTKTTGLIVDITLMAEDDIAAIKEALSAAKVAVVTEQKRQRLDAATAGLPESARAIYSKITEEEEQKPQIIDDREESAPLAATPAAPAQPAAPTTSPYMPEVTAAAEPSPAIVCPRCTWNMRQEYEVAITDFDKEAFVAITLGGERFKKTFSLLKDKYSITLRSLLAEENTIIHHQLLLDQKDGDFLSDTEWYLRMFEYRLACSIAQIEISGQLQRPIPELSEVSGMQLPNKTDDKQKSAIVRLREYVLNDQLKSELTRRLVSTQFRQFQRLYEALEAMALEPNFW